MNEDYRIVLAAVMLPTIVFAYAGFQVYLANVMYNVEFEVFDVWCGEYRDGPKTLILTNGSGKFYFIGNWTGQLIPDHVYNVTYVQRSGYNAHKCNNLIVIEWREVFED